MDTLWDFFNGIVEYAGNLAPGMNATDLTDNGGLAVDATTSDDLLASGVTSRSPPEMTMIDEVTSKLFLVVPPLLICLGLLGNGLSLVVLTSRGFRRTPSSTLLSLMVIIDTLVLLLDLAPSWFGQVTEGKFEIRSSRWGCRCHMFLQHALRYLSSWMVVTVVLERTLSTRSPPKSRACCTNKRAILIFTILLLILSGANLHFLWSADFIDRGISRSRNDHALCQITRLVEDPSSVLTGVYIWYHFLVGFALPLVIVATCLAVMACIICRQRSQRSYNTSTPATFKTKTWTSAMVLALAVVFLIATPPTYLVTLFFFYMGAPADVASLKLIILGTTLLYYVRHAANFIIFIISGVHFRHTTVEMVSYKRHVHEASPAPKESSTKEVIGGHKQKQLQNNLTNKPTDV